MTVPYPTPTPGTAPSAPTTPGADQSIIDYGKSLAATPVTNTGQVSIWNLPKVVLNFEQGIQTDTNSKPLNVPPQGYGEPFWVGTTQMDQGLAHAPKPKSEPGNLYSSADNIYKKLMQMSAGDPQSQAEFRQIQALLAYGPWGSVPKNELVAGQFGKGTQSALGQAMDNYIQLVYASGNDATPVNFFDYLTQASALDPKTGKLKNGTALSGGGAASQVQLANPEDLQQTAQQAAQAALGQNLSPDQLDAFVSQFHNLQQQAAGQTGATATEAPSPTAAAIQFIKQQEPQEFAENEVRQYANALLNELLSGSEQLPSDSSELNQVAALNG